MNFLLEIDKTKGIYDEGVRLGDVLLEGAQIVLIGMVTIFSVLGLLWACLTVFKMVFNSASSKSESQSTNASVNTVFESTEAIDSSADEEIVAVIAAAIAAAESEDCGIKYRVVSFRRY